MKKRYIETGKIVGTHGIKGEVRVQPWCDNPEFLTSFKTLYTDKSGSAIKITSSSTFSISAMRCVEMMTVASSE